MGARYYDPLVGRFQGIDPKEVDPGDIHSFNRYAYANNNPYKFVDPDGRQSVSLEDIRFLTPEKASSAADYWANKQVETGNGLYAIPGAIAEMLAEHGPEVAMVLSTLKGGGAKGLGSTGSSAAGAEVDGAVRQVNPRNLVPTQTRSEMSGSRVKNLEKNMKENGFDQSKPVSAVERADGRLEIQDGHHRVEAAKRAGVDQIPVQVWRGE